jgi:hypothetical protein
LTLTAPDIDQFQQFILQSFSRRGLPIDRCSQIIFSQLARMPNYGRINFPFQFVEHEIRHLEGMGRTSTRPPTPLKGQFEVDPENGQLAKVEPCP